MTTKGNNTVDFDKVQIDEIKIIEEHRKARNTENRGDAAGNLKGLALSGGGIRSASFALGVLQSLAKNGILKEVDYLSTVSGGGYIGSSLTWFLHKPWPGRGEKIHYGTDASTFPFGERGKGARTSDRNIILDFIRQHGNYLDPGQGLNSLSLFAVVLKSIVISFAFYFPLMAFLMYVCIHAGLFEPHWTLVPIVNLNYVSLHRMYRDRLMETFLPDYLEVKLNKWGPAREANRTLLSAMCKPATGGPYHLVNTNVILVDSKDSKYRGRGGDNFILSPLYCGSDSTK